MIIQCDILHDKSLINIVSYNLVITKLFVFTAVGRCVIFHLFIYYLILKFILYFLFLSFFLFKNSQNYWIFHFSHRSEWLTMVTVIVFHMPAEAELWTTRLRNIFYYYSFYIFPLCSILEKLSL